MTIPHSYHTHTHRYIPEVRQLIFALANKVAGSNTELVAQAVGNALYGCQMMTSDHEEVSICGSQTVLACSSAIFTSLKTVELHTLLIGA